MFQMRISPSLAALTCCVAFALPAAAQNAKAEAAMKAAVAVSQEVQKECKLTRTEFPIFVPNDGHLANRKRTRAEYLNDPIEYENAKKGHAACWTRERWQRYVKAQWAYYDASGINQAPAGVN